MNEDDESGKSRANAGLQPWRAFAGWMIVATLAALAAVPYAAAIEAATGRTVASGDVAPAIVWGPVFTSAFAIGIGLVLGPRLGLGCPTGRNRWTSVRLGVFSGVGIGLAVGIVGPWLEGWLVPEVPDTARDLVATLSGMAPWKSVLASLSAGVIEEVLFRFGAMTLCVWLCARLFRHQPATPADHWIAITTAAVLFGLAHLPNAVEFGIPITVGMVLYVLLVDGAAGVVFGWLYWRHGLWVAILSHALADIVLKVVVPLATSATV